MSLFSTEISRRQWLKVGALAASAVPAAAFGLAGCGWVNARAERVIVLGAGLAGLAAAYELSRVGYEVMVLEARDRPGGRVLTLRDDFDDGLYAEAGATGVPEGHSTTVGYAKHFGLTLRAGNSLRTTFRPQYAIGAALLAPDINGRAEWPYELTREERTLGVFATHRRLLAPILERIGDPRSPKWPSHVHAEYDNVSFGELLRQTGLSSGAVRVLGMGYFSVWGDGLESYSALSMLRDISLNRRAGRTFVIEGGTDRLAHAFSGSLGNRIRFSARVESIRQSDTEVHVAYTHGEARHTVVGHYAVCAIPAPCLREISTDPPMVGLQRRVIGELELTSVSRVFLQCRQRVWPEALSTIYVDAPMMIVRDATRSQEGNRVIVEVVMFGDAARQLAREAPKDRVARCLTLLEPIFPGIRRNYERGTSYCWDLDPLAKGDYAWFRPGQLSRFGTALQDPFGRIHFAGDHTSALPGWMQGALESGIRVAAEIHHAAKANSVRRESGA